MAKHPLAEHVSGVFLIESQSLLLIWLSFSLGNYDAVSRRTGLVSK